MVQAHEVFWIYSYFEHSTLIYGGGQLEEKYLVCKAHWLVILINFAYPFKETQWPNELGRAALR